MAATPAAASQSVATLFVAAALGVANGATVVAFLPSACALGGVERGALVVAFVPLAVGLQVSTQKFTVLLPCVANSLIVMTTKVPLTASDTEKLPALIFRLTSAIAALTSSAVTVSTKGKVTAVSPRWRRLKAWFFRRSKCPYRKLGSKLLPSVSSE